MAVIAWEVELVVRAVLAIAVNVYSKYNGVYCLHSNLCLKLSTAC